MKRMIGVALVAAAVVLSGCGSSPFDRKRDRGSEAQQERDRIIEAERAQREAEARGARIEGGFTGHPLEDPASPLSRRVVYFAFDSSAIDAEGRQTTMAHARYLSQNPNQTVVLEGHTDERGSREYNLALGERRANAVRDLMLLNGVSPRQIQVISFGEERPVALGSDESAWRLNRRVEILYSGY